MTEIIKDVVGYEGYYAITRDGKVWRYPRLIAQKKHKKSYYIPGKWICQQKHRKGYMEVRLCVDNKRVSYKVHRLVALAYLDSPVCEDKIYINHKNCIKDDNDFSNLEWVTASENSDHAEKNGLLKNRARGERINLSKLLPEDVIFIRCNRHISSKILANKFNIYHSTVHKIWSYVTWKHVQ